MPQRQLTGSRIRERRIMRGVRQADLARQAGISPSYLNLIEHNRRRIGGKLLVDLATALGVEPSVLSEGAEAALIATLREAMVADTQVQVEGDRVEDFAGRFQGWAELLVRRHRRVLELERMVESLTDRLTHDPHLAASMHDMLTTVTAIRSTAGILAETKELEPEWRDRFHRNINEDSRRLAESSQALVAYLDGDSTEESGVNSPHEELETFLNAHEYHFPWLEMPGGQEQIDDRIATAAELETKAARLLARAHLHKYHGDAQNMPLDQMAVLLEQSGPNPSVVARAFGQNLAAVMRRLGGLPQGLTGPLGLVICDGSGTLTFRRGIEGFPLPRFGAACPLWPLFRALSRPMMPLEQIVHQTGRGGGHFRAFAIAEPVGQVDFDTVPLFQAYMMLVPTGAPAQDEVTQPVGVSCSICSREGCRGRRVPSILKDGLG